MIYSKIGNNKAVLSQAINRNILYILLLNVRLKTAYFRYVPPDGTFFVVARTDAKTVFQNKNNIWWEFRPRLFRKGHLKIFFPEIGVGVRKRAVRFSLTLSGRFRAVLLPFGTRKKCR